MKGNYNADDVAKDFEDYFGKTRGINVAAFGVDIAGHMETVAKVAFFAGYACGLTRFERITPPSQDV